jgi:hypothetical protein
MPKSQNPQVEKRNLGHPAILRLTPETRDRREVYPVRKSPLVLDKTGLFKQYEKTFLSLSFSI